jgi:hypothetical protein
MSVYDNCVEQGVYEVLACLPKELGRVRSVAFVNKNSVILDPTDASEWNALIASGDAIIIPQVRGNYDGGAVSESAGFGDEATEFTGRIHTLNYFDPNLKQNNVDYYNKFTKNAKNYILWYRTETQIWNTNAPLALSAKVAVTENTTDVVTFEVMTKWTNEDIPVPYEAPVGIFN